MSYGEPSQTRVVKSDVSRLPLSIGVWSGLVIVLKEVSLMNCFSNSIEMIIGLFLIILLTSFFFQLAQSSAEADTFFCFVELISGFRDNFCQQLDNSVVGIRSTITKLSQLLKEHDEELWRHLEVTTKVRITCLHSL